LGHRHRVVRFKRCSERDIRGDFRHFADQCSSSLEPCFKRPSTQQRGSTGPHQRRPVHGAFVCWHQELQRSKGNRRKL